MLDYWSETSTFRFWKNKIQMACWPILWLDCCSTLNCVCRRSNWSHPKINIRILKNRSKTYFFIIISYSFDQNLRKLKFVKFFFQIFICGYIFYCLTPQWHKNETTKNALFFLTKFKFPLIKFASLTLIPGKNGSKWFFSRLIIDLEKWLLRNFMESERKEKKLSWVD